MLENTNINQELEIKIDGMQKLLLESVDMLYKAAYNEAIDDVLKMDTGLRCYDWNIGQLKK